MMRNNAGIMHGCPRISEVETLPGRGEAGRSRCFRPLCDTRQPFRFISAVVRPDQASERNSYPDLRPSRLARAGNSARLLPATTNPGPNHLQLPRWCRSRESHLAAKSFHPGRSDPGGISFGTDPGGATARKDSANMPGTSSHDYSEPNGSDGRKFVLMQRRHGLLGQLQLFLSGHGITHLEAVGSGVIGMFKTVPGVQTQLVPGSGLGPV